MRTLTLRRRFGAGRGISTWLGAIWFGTRFRPIRFWTRGLRTSIWLRWNRALVSCGRFRRSIGSSRFWRIVRPVILCRCRAIRIWTIVWHRAIGFRSDWPIVFRAIDVRTVIWLSRNTIVWLRLVWPAGSIGRLTGGGGTGRFGCASFGRLGSAGRPDGSGGVGRFGCAAGGRFGCVGLAVPGRSFGFGAG